MSVGMHAAWKKGKLEDLKRPLVVMFLVALALGLIIPPVAYGAFHVSTVIGLTAGIWVILSALYEPWQRLRNQQSLSRSVIGMTIAHIGVGVFAIGVTVTQTYRIEKDIALRPGQSVELQGYTFDFMSTRPVSGPNYDAIEAEILISRDGRAGHDAAPAEAHLPRADHADDRVGHPREVEPRPVRRDGR